MTQENLNKIYNAGKFFKPKSEPEKPSEPEQKPSNVKRKISVAKAFMPQQEDPFKKKVEAVMKGITEEPASAPDTAGEEEKSVPNDVAEVIVGTGQDGIGKNLAAGKSIWVEGNVGSHLGDSMSGGKIHVEGHAGWRIGDSMSGGIIYIEGCAGNNTGCSMSGGEIYVAGSAGVSVGEGMSNGKILIGEDVAGWVGDCMSGGEIHIGGSAGHSVGRNMSGGIIRINGNVASFDETAFFAKNKGTIIWKGETIWKDGSYTVAGLNIRLNPFAKNKIKIENE